MKIALIGYGKMGEMVEKMAIGHQIVCRVTVDDDHWEGIEAADIGIDFSHSSAVIGNLKECLRLNMNLVIGTTGWESQLEEAKSIVKNSEIGVLYAPNFSLGLHIFLKILEYGAEILNHFAEYESAGLEIHHSKKLDSPSGTALEICRRLEKRIDRLDRLPMSSVRLGSFPGTHQVMFDSPYDTISISHEARSREGFAKGAIKAAEWLMGKKGFYALEDYVKAVSQKD